MDIRSITLGINWEGKRSHEVEAMVSSFYDKARVLCEDNSFMVRTFRLSLQPINLMEDASDWKILSAVKWLSSIAAQSGLRWFCVPFSAFEGRPFEECYDVALKIARTYKNAFINLIVCKDGAINTKSILQSGRFIKDVSRLSNTGHDNFRVGVSCNCKANTPFFPFSYHEGDDGFSIALELVPLFTNIITEYRSEDIEEIRKRILDELISKLKELDALGRIIESETNVRYYGLDASLAPFPHEKGSVAKIIELLGVESFGSNGTLFVISFLTDILKFAVTESGARSTGFNGVMISLLEDAGLGMRSKSKAFSIDSILSYSSVCGCGVDMVPIPGDAFEEEIASVILDVASLSSKLRKPLGVRILPIPLKYENDFTDFNYDFLINTRVMGIRNFACESKMFNSKMMLPLCNAQYQEF